MKLSKKKCNQNRQSRVNIRQGRHKREAGNDGNWKTREVRVIESEISFKENRGDEATKLKQGEHTHARKQNDHNRSKWRQIKKY